jgi:hypothetical protein
MGSPRMISGSSRQSIWSGPGDNPRRVRVSWWRTWVRGRRVERGEREREREREREGGGREEGAPLAEWIALDLQLGAEVCVILAGFAFAP